MRYVLFAALLTVSMRASSQTGGPVSGVVIDKDTNQTIAGAFVVVRWTGYWTNFVAGSGSACYHVETTRTDASGRYQVPFWIRVPSVHDIGFSSGGYDVSLFKPGYTHVSGYHGDTSLMQRFVGTDEEYFDNVLDYRRWLCSLGGKSAVRLRRVFNAAAIDAKARAVTPQQQSLAITLERFADESLVDRSKPTTYRAGRLVNVDPDDSYKPEE